MREERRVVVIGSGPAGAAAARELLQNGIRVTMLESGTDCQRGLLVRVAGRNFYRRTPPLREEGAHAVSGDPRTVAMSSWHREDFPTTGLARAALRAGGFHRR